MQSISALRFCLGLALAIAGLPLAAQDELPWQRQASEGGVAVSVSLQESDTAPRADRGVPLQRELRLDVRVADAASGTALPGVRPRVWLARQAAPGAEACADQARRFVAGRVSQRADRDFNQQLLATLNSDATLSLISPQFAVGSTRLESLITLPGPGADWVYLSGRDQLLVTLPAQGQLAVVDMAAQKLLRRIDLGAGQPRRLVVTPDERRAFVAMDDADALAVVDLAEPDTPVRRLDIGAGLHGLALSDDGSRLVVTSSSAGRVTLIDTARAATLAAHALAGTPLAVAVSPLSRRAYVARANADSLAVLALDDGRLEAPLPFASGVVHLRAAPDGRHLLGLSPRADRLHVLDVARGRLLGSTATVEAPDQIAFTARFAYVRGLGALSVTLLDLAALARGELATNQVPMYQQRPDSQAASLGVADMIVPAPDGAGVLVANGADTAIYAYMEGMQAPQGSYRTYSRAVQGLKLLDRGLREQRPGEWQTRLRLDRGGHYQLLVLTDQPRLLRCFALDVDERGQTAEGQRVQTRFSVAGPARAGQPLAVRVELRDGDSGQPLTGLGDVQLMLLELPGLAQRRAFAAEEAPGVYRLVDTLPREGRWRVALQVASRGLSFERSATLDLDVAPAGAP
ncbi:hypothetical protein AACH10_19770 [Ideonella sp. DXS22W]|uniref:Cytochrome D1 n=1 Tax=Pseudaquabacterium inlustre TaxID=2984192 RepID=A0ABU9CNR3_9BURK